jgi:HK97 family phage major capsid protein
MGLRDEQAFFLNEIDRVTALIEDGADTDENYELVNQLELAAAALQPEMEKQLARLEEERNMKPVKDRNRAAVEREANGGGNGLAGRVLFRDSNTGKDIRAFAHGESMATALRSSAQEPYGGEQEPDGDFDIGRVITAKLLNRMDMLSPYEIKASAHGGSETDGGYLLNPAGSMQVLDLARSASRIMQAGAMTVPMNARELNVVRVTGDPTAQWRAEAVAVTASNPTFDRVTLRARTLAAIVPISIEMLEDAANAADQIKMLLQTALGAELDRAALMGTGGGEEPIGIVNTVGVDEQSSVGTPADYTDVSASILAILNGNYPGEISDLAWLAAPAQFGTYDGLVSSVDAQPLIPTPWASQLRKLATTKLSGTMVVGDFSQLLIGMRTSGVRIEVLPAGTATDANGTSYNATSQLMRHIVAHLRADVVCLRPTWFSKLTGVTA